MKKHSRLPILPLVIVVIWMGFLIYLVSVPQPYIVVRPSPKTFTIGHYLTHAVLAGLFYVLFSLEESNFLGRIRKAAIATGLTLLISLLIEFVQFFIPERGVEARDIVFGLFGAVCGVALLVLAEQYGVRREHLRFGAAAIVAGSVLLVLVGGLIRAWS